ncbi:MAG: MarR family transcriptional regulator [Bacilli bacterium]|nr:MarR family transcriptional regulator [Bacilli bacterium]
MRTELPGQNIVRLGRLLRNSFANEFRNRFGDEISPTGDRILAYLRNNPGTNQSRIAALFELTKSTASEVLSFLEVKGYLESRIDPNDKRGKQLFITEKGKRINELSRETLLAHDARLFADVTDEELAAFNSIYEKVTAKMKEAKQ